jgi:hypothetical protein
MRPRLLVLAAALTLFGTAAVPTVAEAAPHHNYHLTIAVTPNPIEAGDGVLIYGTLRGANSSDQTIYLYHHLAALGPGYTFVQKTTTNSFGEYAFTRAEGVVETNRSWFVRGPNGSHSRTIYEHVAALVSLTSSTMNAVTGHRVVFSGGVIPNHPFEPVRLQEQTAISGNGWSTIATTFTNGASAFSLSHGWARPGIYTVRALFPGDARNIRGESDSVTLTVQQKQNPSFTINSSSPVIPEGQSVMISGVLYEPGSMSTPEPSTEVTLYGKVAGGGGFIPIASTPTGMDGSYSFMESPTYNTVYKVETTLKPRRVTADLYQGVQDVVTLTSPSTAATMAGGSVTITGTVSPDKTGHAIYLQQLGPDGHWHDVQLSVVGTGSTFSFTYTLGKDGTFQLRARIFGDRDNVGGASAPVTVTVTGVEPVTSLPPAS